MGLEENGYVLYDPLSALGAKVVPSNMIKQYVIYNNKFD